ncbi:RHS repeat-associated core domain-containing protein [Pseudoxanthomonas sp. 22568]|uniref:RHS repeat-associated core domain-containing protein n=1 Tax=Pseudoxanthomonas sp. 22568 TaxID=3453945 RepID=UPI003F8389D8
MKISITKKLMILSAFGAITSNADARFLSVDPVQAKNNGTNFNRYNYANNNPYRFVDPDGRSAIVIHHKDGSYTIQFPAKFRGDAATVENISKVKDIVSGMSGEYAVNGKNASVRVEITGITKSTPRKARNDVLLTAGPAPSTASGRSNAEVGGKKIEIDVTDRFRDKGVPVHEFGHNAGLEDLYDPITGKPNPTHGNNIMNKVPGEVDSSSIEQIINSGKNTHRKEK